MLFNTSSFFIFFAVVYTLYFFLPHRAQNRMLLVASYFFYGAWDWRFLPLLGFYTLINYYCALWIAESEKQGRRKFFLLLSLVTSLGFLGFFKYFNFFYQALVDFTGLFGYSIHGPALKILLPIGISFYTFQTLSYTLDVYRGLLKPVRSLSDFALFIAFFPQLVIGPIERGRHLLPQLMNPRTVTLDHLYHGCWLIAWGLYKKVFVADNLAVLVNGIFAKTVPLSGLEVLLGSYAFLFQIYADFSGYSDMARGLAKLMGIELMINFKFPYFVLNPRDFWRNWHISLSNWFRDYVFLPLSRGGRSSALNYAMNTLITLLLMGLWHGAAWNFVLFGLYHGVLLILFRNRESVFQKKGISPWGFWLGLLVMFHLLTYGCLIFRAQSLAQIAAMTSALFTNPLGSAAAVRTCWDTYLPLLLGTVWFLVAVDFALFRKKDIDRIRFWPVPVRAFCYVVIFYSLLWYSQVGGKEFVYYQF